MKLSSFFATNSVYDESEPSHRRHHWKYRLFILKRIHHCLSCWSRARQESSKAAVASKINDARTEEQSVFSKGKNLENAIKNPMITDLRLINELCSS